MASLDQERAKLAFTHIESIRTLGREEQKKYASIVYAMPALLRSAGLSQALHFVLGRRDEAQAKLLDHLAKQLQRVDEKIAGSKELLESVRNAELMSYLRLTREAIACIDWYKRFVQGVLRIEAGELDDARE